MARISRSNARICNLALCCERRKNRTGRKAEDKKTSERGDQNKNKYLERKGRTGAR